MPNKDIFLILDSNSILYRAYHALPKLTTKKGETINGVYGFLLVFLKAIRDFNPKFICACFDFPAKTFRHEKLKEYKATRPPPPDDLIFQIGLLKKVLVVFNIPIFEKKGFEADDLIGTISHLASRCKDLNIEVIILSGDLDVLQLVTEKTKVFLLKKGVKNTILYTEELIKQQYQGLEPFQLVDVKALKGDVSDNIPGISGIGEKTALELIKKFGSLENLFEKINENNFSLKGKIREILEKNKEQVFLNRELAEIKKNTPLDFDLKKCESGHFDKNAVISLFSELEFKSLIKRLPEIKRGSENLKLW